MNFKINKKFSILIIVLVAVLIVYCYFLLFSNKEIPGVLSMFNEGDNSVGKITDTISNECLKENESADFVVNEEYINKDNKWSGDPATIVLANKITKKEISRFDIASASDSAFTLWLMPCGVYVNRQFNYDFKSFEMEKGFRSELWKYDYKGNGKFLFTIYVPEDKEANYSPSFAVSPDEKHIAMLRQDFSAEHPKQFIFIKDLKTFEDVYVFDSAEFLLKNPELTGDDPRIDDTIQIEDFWSKDGKYFWVRTNEFEWVYSYIRIDPYNKKYDAFISPAYAMGGDALNTNNGYVTYVENSVWTGETFASEEAKEEYVKENKFAYFYVYNLFTKEQVLLYKNQDPTWNYQPRWISEDTLEYKIPDGKIKTYKISL